MFIIDANTMAAFGVSNFQPLEVVVSEYHPTLYFIRCLDKIVIMEFIDKKFFWVNTVVDPAIRMGSDRWRFVVTRSHLVLAFPPKYVAEYSL